MTELIDVKALSDDDLAAVLDAARAEWQRRRDLGAALDTTPGLIEAYLDSTGRANGEPWVQPTGYHDAYPEGWEVTWDDRLWVSLTPGNIETPGVSGWREVPTDGGVPAWVQPVGYHDAYKTGDKVAYEDHVWESTADSNVWEPGSPGSPWSDLGPIDDYQPETGV